MAASSHGTRREQLPKGQRPIGYRPAKIRCKLCHGRELEVSRQWRAKEGPMVVEIVDRTERVGAFLPEANALVADGMVTVERAGGNTEEPTS
jgi:hypothetical protein